jgi:hypothetical protein
MASSGKPEETILVCGALGTERGNRFQAEIPFNSSQVVEFAILMA